MFLQDLGHQRAQRCISVQKSNGYLHFILFERDGRYKCPPPAHGGRSGHCQVSRRGATAEEGAPSSLHLHRLTKDSE